MNDMLNDDVIVNILKYIDIPNIVNIRLTCKQYNNIMNLNIIWDFFLNRDFDTVTITTLFTVNFEETFKKLYLINNLMNSQHNEYFKNNCNSILNIYNASYLPISSPCSLK